MRILIAKGDSGRVTTWRSLKRENRYIQERSLEREQISFAKMATASIKIDPLTGYVVDYDTWKIHIRGILKNNDLWDYVSGTKPKPTAIKDSKDLEEWLRNDEKAESDILLPISASELVALDGLETSKAIWDKL